MEPGVIDGTIAGVLNDQVEADEGWFVVFLVLEGDTSRRLRQEHPCGLGASAVRLFLLPHGEGFPKLLSLKLEYPDLLDVDVALLFEL